MATEYTRNFRLAKPDFRTSPWSAQLNENAERIDTLIYNALQAHGILVYDNGVLVPIGQIMYDPDLNTFWVNTIEHTTKITGDFVSERADNPGAWVVLQFAWTPRGQWIHSTIYNYYDIAYDPSVGLTGVCIVPHSSPATGTMEDEIDKWIIIADVHGISSALIAFDNTGTGVVATNVQDALIELDADLTVAVNNAAQKVANLSDLLDKAAARSNLDMAAFGTSGLYLGTGYDLNTLTKNGFYIGQEFVNGPAPTIWFYIQHEALGSVGPTYHFQRAVGLDGTVYKRSCQSGTWSAWTAWATNLIPTVQTFTSGSGTYTTPVGCKWIEVEKMVGGAGGGAGGGSSPGNGGNGGNTTFGPLTANGGAGAIGASGGAGGSASGGYVNSTGARGQNGSGVANTAGGNGGISPLGGAGWGGAPGGGNGVAGAANSGSGGGGGGCFSTPNGGGGGASGGNLRAIINNPSASYSYAVGAGGTAGTAGGGSGGAGAAGGSGVIIVIEHYGN